jgi:hypothetical protein
MAAAYLVTLPATSGQTRYGDVDTVVVYANDATNAKLLAKAKYGAGDDAAWDAATVTELVVGADLEGWVFRVVATDPADDSVVVDVEVTGAAADQIDDIGDALVVALDATDAIAASAYDSGTNVLTVAEIADGIGDHILTCFAYPPAASYAGSRDVNFTGFFSTVVDEGVAGAVLTVVLVALSIPTLYAGARAYS